ncbi:MAG: cell division protein ZapA [Pseudomonas sp.]
MSQPLTVTLHILDKEYQVACPPDERYNLEEAARHLDATMRDIRNRGKVIGLERIAVMAALNISHEMLTGSRQQHQQASEQQQQIAELATRLDQALTRHQE